MGERGIFSPSLACDLVKPSKMETVISFLHIFDLIQNDVTFQAVSSSQTHMHHISSNLSLIRKCTTVSYTTKEEKL